MSGQRVIGVDLGGTKIAAAVVDRSGGLDETRQFVRRPTPTGSQAELLEALDDTIARVLGDDVAALGIGIPSRIDQRTGRAEGSVNIPLADLEFRDRMAERFGLPVGIENDANAASLAEWTLGAGRGTSDMVMLTLGTGVGGGLVLDGVPFRGWAELGHVVVLYDGPPCQGSCTGRGHLEALTSGHAADAAAREVLGPGSDAHGLVERAREGDARAREALAEIGRRLGAGIGSLVNIFRPELVVIGGGFGAAAFEFLLEPAREVIAREALEPVSELVRIEEAILGNEAGLVGAGLIGFRALDAASPS
ncbi:MAG: ROK family protein [Gaiellaceae bacterium]